MSCDEPKTGKFRSINDKKNVLSNNSNNYSNLSEDELNDLLKALRGEWESRARERIEREIQQKKSIKEKYRRLKSTFKSGIKCTICLKPITDKNTAHITGITSPGNIGWVHLKCFSEKNRPRKRRNKNLPKPKYPPILPSSHPEKEGKRKKKMRGE